MKLYQGKLEPYLLWLTALNLHSLPRALLSSDYLHLVCIADDVWKSDPDGRIVAALKPQLSSRAEKLQDGDAIQVTSHLDQQNSNSEKRTITTSCSRQRFSVYSFSHTLRGSYTVRFKFLSLKKKKNSFLEHKDSTCLTVCKKYFETILL